MEFKNSDQLNSYLKKEACRLHMNIKSVRSTFFARMFLEILSKVNYNEILCKGSTAELAYMGKLLRAITDIDLATKNNFSEGISTIASALNANNNGILFDMPFPLKQTKTGIYKVTLRGNIGKTKEYLNIDFQEHYSRLIELERRIIPKIFEGDREFEIYLPSYEEHLAEKICIILESNDPNILNTRVKDFYDIYELHGGAYDPDKLTEYFKRMIQLRGKIKIEDADTTIFNKEFVEKHEGLWQEAIKKYEFIDKKIDLEGAVYYSRGVAREQLQKAGQTLKRTL